MFVFSFDDARQLALLRVDGFLQAEDVLRFNREVREAVADARRRYGRVRMLCDTRDAPAQPRSAIDAWDDPGILMRDGDRYAILVSSSLLRMQVRRVVDEGRSRLFDDPVAAHAWLSEP